jgi:hypothetical protein
MRRALPYAGLLALVLGFLAAPRGALRFEAILGGAAAVGRAARTSEPLRP